MSAVAWKFNGEKCPLTKIDKDGNGLVVTYYDNGREMMRQTFRNFRQDRMSCQLPKG